MKLVILVVAATVAYAATLSDSDKRAVGVCLATQVSDNTDRISGAGSSLANKSEMDKSINAMKAQLTAQLNALKAKYTKAKADAMATMKKIADKSEVPDPKKIGTGGTTYIRWGRWTCPNLNKGTKPVYTGWMGGAYYQHRGSGSEYLCMADVAEWGSYNNGNQDAALLYPTEAEFSGYGIQTGAWKNLSNKELPCVVCETKQRSRGFMIPGRKTCPKGGWTFEYWGYLTAAHYSHTHATSWICMDGEAKPNRVHNAGNQNGSLIYPTEIECHTGGHPGCGSINNQRIGYPSSQTQRYVHNRELTCAQCTK